MLNLGNAVHKMAIVIIIMILITITMIFDVGKCILLYPSSLVRSQIIFPGFCQAEEKPDRLPPAPSQLPPAPSFLAPAGSLLPAAPLQPFRAGLDEKRNGKVSTLTGKAITGSINITSPGHGLKPCVGDGVTDNSTNFQAIIDWTYANGMPTIYAPNGTYICNMMEIYPGMTLQGQSTSGTIFKRAVCTSYVQPLFDAAGGRNGTQWPYLYSSAAWSGTNTNTTSGNVVIDSTKDFTGLVGKTVYNAYNPASGPYMVNRKQMLPGQPNFAVGVITSAGPGTFTVAGGLSGGLLSNKWSKNDHYDIAVDSKPLTLNNFTVDGNWGAQKTSYLNEFAGLIALAGNAAYAGKLTVVLNNLKFRNNAILGGSTGGADGLYCQDNVNLTANKIYGSLIGRGLICVNCGWNVISATNFDSDGTGTLYHNETNGQTGYSYQKYGISNGSLECAPVWQTLSYFHFHGHSSMDWDPAGGSTITSTLNNWTVDNIEPGKNINMIFEGGGPNQTITINNSTFNNGSSDGNNDFCIEFGQGTYTLNGCNLMGLPTATPISNGCYNVIKLAATGSCQVTLNNTSMDVDPSVVRIYTGGMGGVSQQAAGNMQVTTTGTTSFSNRIGTAVACNTAVLGGIFKNTGYIYDTGYIQTGTPPFSVTYNNPTISGSASYFRTEGTAILTGTITQTNVTIPDVNAGVYIAGSSNITVRGRKTITGRANPPAGTQNAFGDDLLGSGNGDYYLNSGAGKEWRCTTSGYHDSPDVNSAWQETK